MNHSLRTILVVAPYFPPHSGGLERYAFEIAKEISKSSGTKIVVITSGEQGSVDDIQEENGLLVYRLGYQMKVSNTPISLSWFFKIRRIMREVAPDIIHIHTPVPGIGDIAAMFARVPIVVSYHTGSMRKGKLIPDSIIWLYEHIILPYLLRRADLIACASEYVRNDFLKQYQYKSETITPGVDSDFFYPDPLRRQNIPTLVFSAAGLNRADDYKGLRTALDAVVILKKEFPEVKILITGDGDMRTEYEAYARAKGIAENASFLGVCDRDQMRSVFRQGDVLIHPSLKESFGMVILEAMSTGLPVVASKIGGIPFLVSEGVNGYLIEDGNPLSFAEKITLILRDATLRARLAEANRNKAIQEYSWEVRSNRYCQLFQTLAHPTIVVIAPYYPPHVGGMERVAFMGATMVAENGYRVHVIASTAGGGSSGIERSGILSVTERLRTIDVAHTPFTPSLFFTLARIPRRSIIHFHLSQAFWPEVTLFISALRGIPYIVHFHLDVDPSGLLGSLFVVYKKIVWGPFLRAGAKVIVCSSEMGRLVSDKYRVPATKIIVIPNAIDDAFFVDSSRIYSGNDPLQLLSIGRLVPQKRCVRMLEALRLMKAPAELTIVGDGEDRESLIAYATKYKLPVTFAGFKNDREMREYHKTHDLFIISSDREGGTPLTVLEAMAGGMPIVGSNVPGIRDLIAESGVLIDEPYGVHFAEMLDRLGSRPEELTRLSKESLQKAKHYDRKSFFEKLRVVYDDLLI